MVRILRLLLGLVAVVVIMTFAIANRTPVDVSLAPLPILFELPVYGVFLFGLAFGMIVGAAWVAIASVPKRREARRMRNKVWALENQLNLMRQQEERAQAARYAPTQQGLTVQRAG